MESVIPKELNPLPRKPAQLKDTSSATQIAARSASPLRLKNAAQGALAQDRSLCHEEPGDPSAVAAKSCPSVDVLSWYPLELKGGEGRRHLGVHAYDLIVGNLLIHTHIPVPPPFHTLTSSPGFALHARPPRPFCSLFGWAGHVCPGKRADDAHAPPSEKKEYPAGQRGL